ncbi:3-keto-disaccharide hydrolase [Ulvibacterium sp.]|uniref:3-keto-disaccharide hydrolase n=1 Tax=Ulvibacterium sp. TaxID=2665914 RepID=UPI003BA9DEFD
MNKRAFRAKSGLWKGLACIALCCCFLSCKEKKTQPSDEKSTEILNENDGFVRIFDGKTLDGWEGDPTYWRVENGNLTGKVTPQTLLKNNTFIIWEGGEPDDFELKLEYRITENGNSGINYRSKLMDTIPFALRGYQADIDGKNRYTGQNYEEKKRTTLAYRGEQVSINSQDNAHEPGSLSANVEKNCWQKREVLKSLGHKDSLATHIKKNDWNRVHLVVNGNRLKHYVNDILMSDVTDNDTINRSMSGKLGVQVHVGPPMTVEYRNIRLKTY